MPAMATDHLRVEECAGRRDGQRVLRCIGPLTIHTLFAFQSAVREETGASLIIDMSEVPYIDSAGLGSLVQAYVSYQKAGRPLAFAGANERARTLLKMTNLEQFLPMFASRAEAEQALC